jgi:hypothetical protein
MAQKTEFLFVDPFVPDLKTLLENLRPESQAVVLDERRPAAKQMAEVLEGVGGLDAIHIVAHGAPGRLCFTAGEWSAETLGRDARAFSTIGRVLAQDGDLRLWSCDTGRGAAGEAFVEALEDATGVYVGAASALVGAAALGGQWELAVGQVAPLTTIDSTTSPGDACSIARRIALPR